MPYSDTIAVIGQGYVGLPLALAFAAHYSVLGYDISVSRVEALNQGRDRTLEVEEGRLQQMLALAVEQPQRRGYRATSELSDIAHAQIYIVTVPTPIDEFNAPDLSFLQQASLRLVRY